MEQYTKDSWSQNNNLVLLSNDMIEPSPQIGIGKKVGERRKG